MKFSTFLVTGAILGILVQYLFNNTLGKSPVFPPNKPVLPGSPSPVSIREPSTVFPLDRMILRIDGSTSMARIGWELKSAFQDAFANAIVLTNARGTDTGIRDLLAGKIDLAALSRPLTPAEERQGLIAVPIAQDAIAIVVGENNPFRQSLTKEQLTGIFTGKITNWSELGGENRRIRVINRSGTSGTRQVFQELILQGRNFGNGTNFTTLDRDATTPLLRMLGTDGIGYATYDQIAEQLTVRVLPIEGIKPNSKEYPYRRTLYYAYRQPASENVRTFLDFIASVPGRQAIASVRSVQEKENAKSPVTTANKALDKAVVSTPVTSPSPVKNGNILPISKQKKALRGIYLSRYQITNNASEQMIRERVRFYRSQGFNTIVQGVWGNGCTMYDSEVSARILGYRSCPNEFNEQWLDWLLDEAHKQGMEVHAYFEKGIKIDKNSPIFDRAIARKWLVPGVDRTYAGIEHYVLDVEVPEVASLFTEVVTEFAKKYPTIDAVQWDDYLGYHAELPGRVDRTDKLTRFVQKMISSMKKANPSVSFDICHHNPYWAKRYFAADWQKWGIDRAFIQAYNEKNYPQELQYARQYAGIAITDRQLEHLKSLVKNQEIKSVFVFPFSGDPEKVAILASPGLKP